MNDLNNKNRSDEWIRLFDVSMPPPKLGDNTADADRLVRYIKKTTGSNFVSIPFPLLKKLPSFLREYKYRCNVALYCFKEGWRIIDVYPPEADMHVYAVAIDLVSSTVVIRMIDTSM